MNNPKTYCLQHVTVVEAEKAAGKSRDALYHRKAFGVLASAASRTSHYQMAMVVKTGEIIIRSVTDRGD